MQTTTNAKTILISQTGCDGNGYQTNLTNAYTDSSVFAVDTDSGKNSNSSCTNTGKDKHRFYNFGINMPGTTFLGIEVRLDAKVDSTLARPNYVSSYPGMLAPVGRLPNKLAR